jgi:hypothetical protein
MSDAALLRLGRWVTANRDLLNLIIVGLLVSAITVLAFVAVAALHSASVATARADCNTRLITALTGDSTLPAADPSCSMTSVRRALEDRAVDKARIAQLEADRRARHLPTLPQPTVTRLPDGGRVVVVPSSRITLAPEAPRTGPGRSSQRPSAARSPRPAATTRPPSQRPPATSTPSPRPCLVTLPPLGTGLPTCVRG